MGWAIIHFVGALGASVGFAWLTLFVVTWEQRRIKKRRLQDASIELGVSVASLETDDSLLPRIVQYSSKRFSDELLRNRLSDSCGVFRAVWDWLGVLLQLAIVIGVSWAMYADGSQNAAYMWTVPVLAIFFWLLSLCFSLCCLLFVEFHAILTRYFHPILTHPYSSPAGSRCG